MAGPVIEGENYRISVLTESLVRLEYSEDGVLKMVRRKLYNIEILDLLPVRS